MERCVFNHCYPHLSPFLHQLQHGFQPGKSTETQLLEVYHDILDKLANGQEVDVIHLDLSKAFDKVPHRLLLSKLQLLGISGPVLLWFSSYLSDRYQRVVDDGISPDWLPVTSGVPQGSILGPLLFLVFINDMSCSITHESKLGLFADDSKLSIALLFPIDVPPCCKLTWTTPKLGVTTTVCLSTQTNVKFYTCQREPCAKERSIHTI